MNPRSEAMFARAQRSIPAGVNSPVRAFRAVGGSPRFIARGMGPHVWDIDGHRYIDYVLSWGPMIVGHAHAEVLAAVGKAASQGLSFGAPTEAEILLVERLCAVFPGMDMARLVSSGTEATMSALRLARGFSGRNKIIKFEGCYHGHADSLLVKAGSGALTFGQPSSSGVPPETAGQTLVVPYNDTNALADAFKTAGSDIAAVIVEPVAGNMNLVAATPEFLRAMRELCTRAGAVLIFDEVMTGFRVHPGGAQALYGIQPDLVTLGKVIGGGMPVGAFGGRADIMRHIAPLGGVYQAGTLSGNPVAMAAGLATLDIVQRPGFYESLFKSTGQLVAGLNAAAKRRGVGFCAHAVGSMFGLYFRDAPPTSFAEIMSCDKEAFNRFFHAALEAGVYFAPSAYEAGFVSGTHTTTEIEQTIAVCDAIFAQPRAT
ncbi:MAG: glutamate-1-semialdehyde-2,1-aminomutase [Betaproteobacteria bacterium]|nr:glutamate-1-semialdehyde-2,1-aminomutase [Betaproteobacteria bacterium]